MYIYALPMLPVEYLLAFLYYNRTTKHTVNAVKEFNCTYIYIYIDYNTKVLIILLFISKSSLLLRKCNECGYTIIITTITQNIMSDRRKCMNDSEGVCAQVLSFSF